MNKEERLIELLANAIERLIQNENDVYTNKEILNKVGLEDKEIEEFGLDYLVEEDWG